MSMRASGFILACAGTLCAQDLVGDYPGRPPKAPLVTLSGLVGSGKMATDSTIVPQGPVARVLWEEFQVKDGGKAQPVLRETITCEFDEQGREVTRTDRQGSMGTKTVTTHQNGHVVSETSRFTSDGEPGGAQEWNYWTYDPSGHLTDFRRGRGNRIESHYTNFGYDQQGRLTDLEYHQGSDDALSSRSEYKYSDDGKTIEESVHQDNQRFHWERLTLDDQGHVLYAETHDQDPSGSEGRIERSFKYDSKGRLIEQVTKLDPARGSESPILPGKITVGYDDTKHTQEIVYSGGKESAKTIIWLDERGAVLGSSTSLNGGPESKTVLDCIHDSHGNWAECRRWGTHDGQREMNRLWRRVITYR